MPELNDHYEFRDAMAAAIVRDLVGPGRNDEPRDDETRLTEPPMSRYIAGVLYPQSPDPLIDPVEDNDIVDVGMVDRDDEADPPVAMANVRYPSAMGLTFAVDSALAEEVTVTVSAGRYESTEVPKGEVEHWDRIPVHLSRTIEIRREARDERVQIGGGLELFVRERKPDGDGHSALTIALINGTRLPHGEWRKDPHSFFQVEFEVDAGGADAFVDRTLSNRDGVDDDARSFALLYRHSPVFATGHGCSAEWTRAEGASRATSVRSTVSPSHDLLLSDNNPDVTSDFFGMRALAEGDRAEVIAGLREFVDGYRRWIDDKRREVDSLGAGFAVTARRHLDDCVTAAERMSSGIDLLADERDPLPWTAFQLANRAMLLQRSKAEWNRGDRTGAPDAVGDHHRWRAFQIGFVLLTIRGIAEPESDDRDVVDLLWFPTGGGKTEAYLGLIAFTIFLRRLRGVAGGGTGAGMTVIMRYTLRLLTLQQYQRAAMLICACETIRRSRNDLGDEEVSICLWVGGAATPATLSETRTALSKLRAGSVLDEGNPVQLNSCPWCATKLSPKDYWVADRNPRLVISCPNEDCDFTKGLPCYLVDEDVYRWRPSVMIATVDKFASIPWRDYVGSLFNVDDVEPPPELIIQDELHLISGPLGTMVGLYETAVHMLCSDGGIGPKIVASTATIRRAEQQIRKLYAAPSFQFPPPGIDARDSYFAVEVPREQKGSRRYVGLMAPGTSQATLLVRSYAAALQTAFELEGDDDVRDPYWTLLGYFNSLRVLGGARMQVRSDVCDRIDVLAGASGARPRFSSGDLEMIEMTSRVESSRIPVYLDQMALTKSDRDCLDVVLATNMISVGVDVDRLGLMAVMGQPQSASEYIQATSRVGRRYPGLVLVLLNSARSRDRSHYEDFVAFHSSLYRQVDASSVTPFAARARDRALHAVFIGMLRARFPEFRQNAGAANAGNLAMRAKPVIDQILARVAAVEPDEVAGTEISLRDLIAEWQRRAAENPKLVFSNRRRPEDSLLIDAAQPEVAALNNAFGTMWSLRAVDTESNLFLVRD